MDVPSNSGEITTAWLTWALRSCKAVTTASVKSCTIEVVGAEKGITGELVRLGIGHDRDERGAPGHLIAKFSSSLPEARALLQSMGFYEREVGFYQELAGSTPLRTPRCHFGHVDAASGLSMLLLEDLAPARNGDSVQTFSLGEVTRVLEALAALHASWWRSSSVAAKPWLRLKAMAAPETMAPVFAKSWPFFLDKLSVPHTPDILDAGRWIHRELGHAADVLFLQEPRTLIHNDVQGDNLFFDDAGGIVALVDWQLTTCARPVVDVASLIRANSIRRPGVNTSRIWSRLITRLWCSMESRTTSSTNLAGVPAFYGAQVCAASFSGWAAPWTSSSPGRVLGCAISTINVIGPVVSIGMCGLAVLARPRWSVFWISGGSSS
jgi:hypothetical protein